MSATTEFDQWCTRVNLGVMETIFSRALERAKEFEQETGVFVFVLYPAQVPSGLAMTAQEMLFMKLSIDDTVVHLYSARNPGKYPALHVVAPSDGFRSSGPSSQVDGPPSGNRSPAEVLKELAKQRLVSKLMARVYPTRDGGFVLYEPGEKDERAKLDDIVFHLFDQVIRRSPRFRRG
jgi:hypothetical protein